MTMNPSVIYLTVPYDESRDASYFGAKWDRNAKSWYVTSDNLDLEYILSKWNKRIIENIINEDRTFGGNILFVDMIPQNCWFSNVRSAVSPKTWDEIRKFCYARAGKCECCGCNGRLECHERWSYESFTFEEPPDVTLFDRIHKIEVDAERMSHESNVEEHYEQKLVRLVALCHDCHESTHMGLAEVNKRLEEAKQHLGQVNSWDKEEVEVHCTEAVRIWKARSVIPWKLNLKLLEDNNFEIVNTDHQGDRSEYANRKLEEKNKS